MSGSNHHPHLHDHSHDHSHDTGSSLRMAFGINLVFTLIEIAGGVWTGSLAILSDAVHDLGDSLALGLAWYLENYSSRGEDRRFSYGYRRFSLLGALINAAILTIGSVVILTEALPRLFNPPEPFAPGMVGIAVLGVAANGLAVLRLRNGRNLNARLVFWHLFEDVLGWVAVLMVSLTLLFFDLPILDPLLSIAITIYVLYNVIRNLRRTLTLFLQGVPEQIDIDTLEQRLLTIEQVLSTHHTHVWSLDGEHHVLSTHVVVDQDTSRQEIQCIKEEIRSLSEELDLIHTTVEIEYGDEGCGMYPGPQWNHA